MNDTELNLIPRSTRDKSLISVRKLGHITLITPDIERQVEYYTGVLGLALTERSADRAYLASAVDHHSVVLEKGDQPSCAKLSFQVAPETDLREFARQLDKMGVATQLASDTEPGIPAVLSMRDPKGTLIEVFAEREPSPQRYAESGIVPFKLGHVAYTAPDIQTSVNWYKDALGFRVSDWLGDMFAFLRCGPDHHTVNFLRGPQVRMQHFAFELMDWAHVQRACDILARNGYPLLWGPGRHGIGHNIFAYHKTPDGHIVELFTELDQINDEELGYFEPRPWHHDRPQRPKVWVPDIKAANLWGVPPREHIMD